MSAFVRARRCNLSGGKEEAQTKRTRLTNGRSQVRSDKGEEKLDREEKERKGSFFFFKDKQVAGTFSRNPAARMPWMHGKLEIVEGYRGAASIRRHDRLRRKLGAKNQNPPCTASPLSIKEIIITCILVGIIHTRLTDLTVCWRF